MSERFLRKNIYQIGVSYQLDSFNPVYLDKTGELIFRSEGLLKNWNGNMNEFTFHDTSGTFQGKVSTKQFWYSYLNQIDFAEDNLRKFSNFVSNANDLIESTYAPKDHTRIGLRMQYILKKTPTIVKTNYNGVFPPLFSELSGFGPFKTTAIGFDVETSQCTLRINVNYGVRQGDPDPNAPNEGLMFDLDYHKTLPKLNWTETKLQHEELVTFAQENYQDALIKLAKRFGALNE